MYFYHSSRSQNRIETYSYQNKGQNGSAFPENQLIAMPNTSNEIRNKIFLDALSKSDERWEGKQENLLYGLRIGCDLATFILIIA